MLNHSLSYISGKHCPHKQRGLQATLTLSCLSQSPDRTANSDRSSRVQGVRTSGFNFATILAVPNADSFPLYFKLPTEIAQIFRVLADFHFLTCFLKLAPCRVPYFPMIPAFFVCLVMVGNPTCENRSGLRDARPASRQPYLNCNKNSPRCEKNAAPKSALQAF